MPRYFLEVSYRGTKYSGFQLQENANTIQAEVEKAITILFHSPSPLSGEGSGVRLTGSSRTDTGVHAVQNYFHFDTQTPLHNIESGRIEETGARFIYKLNAILPEDIVVKQLIPVADDAHCRFDAISREYRYYIYRRKDPFLRDRAFYFPYKLDKVKMQEAASLLKDFEDFTSFSKRRTQVKTFSCRIMESNWSVEGECLVYTVRANRFLRGMVRGLVGTMLQVGRNKLTIAAFRDIIESKDCTKASFAVPGKGLFLVRVDFPVTLNIEH